MAGLVQLGEKLTGTLTIYQRLNFIMSFMVFCKQERRNENHKYEKENEFDKWLKNKLDIKQDKQWKRIKNGEAQPPYNVTLPTFIRNSIHHPENTENDKYSDKELRESIQTMIDFIKRGSPCNIQL